MIRTFFLFIVFWFIIAVLIWTFSSHRRESLMRRQWSMLRRGWLQKNGWGFFRPTIHFRYGQTVAIVDVYLRQNRWDVKLMLPWRLTSTQATTSHQSPPNKDIQSPLPPLVLTTHADRDHPLHRANVLKPVSLPGLGAPQVFLNSDANTDDYLGERGLWELSQLASHAACDSMTLQVDRGQWQLRGHLRCDDITVLDQWLRQGLTLYDQMLVQTQSEVLFDQKAVQLVAQARCGVCGQDIIQDMVYCKRCKSPFHADCWNYAGRCSIFGCGESESQTVSAHQTT